MQQQPNFQHSSKFITPADVFGPSDGKSYTDNVAANSALIENLTALAKLDQLESEQQQPSINISHQNPYNLSQVTGADGNMRSQPVDSFHRTTCNNGYPMGTNWNQDQRFNVQPRSCQQHIHPQTCAANEQQNMLLQIAALVAASEQQRSTSGISSICPPRAQNPVGSSQPPMMPSTQSFRSGINEYHRHMPIGGRGSPMFGHIDSMNPVNERRMFRGKE